MMSCFEPSWPRGPIPSRSRLGFCAVSPQSAIGLANSGYCCPLLARAGNPNWHGAAEDDGEMTRPWTDDEMHRLRVLAKGKVSAYYIAKSLGRSAGSVKLRARSLGLILYKKAKAKVK